MQRSTARCEKTSSSARLPAELEPKFVPLMAYGTFMGFEFELIKLHFSRI